MQLYSVIQSNYIYSAITREPTFENDYYRFNAGISFAVSPDSQTGLNADIIMQSRDSQYDDSIYWNADKLSEYGIAISKNLAKFYDLHLNDKLYSKHIVNGGIYEYSIEYIIPETANVRISKDKSYNNGIIIMGYDGQYVDNVTHNSIAFTKDSIDELSVNGMPEDIIYREDEIIAVLKNIVPYLSVCIVIFITITILSTFLFTKSISYNFIRLVMMGFEKKRLNKSYFRFVCGFGLLSIVISLVLSNVIFLIIEVSAVEILILTIITLIELITLFITSAILNKHLWRK
ncbi:MAG: hypothetical protein NC253_04180 [Ruminococcus sp.]|nr:hypothetical protein [Ruminococcus sp.]